MEEKIIEIFNKHGVILGYLFGSYARGTTGPLSDIDVAVVFPREIDKEEENRKIDEIKYEIEKIFNIKRADVINLRKNTNIALGYKIVFEGKVLVVNDSNLKFSLESKYMRDFEDTKYLRSVQFKILMNKIYVAN